MTAPPASRSQVNGVERAARRRRRSVFAWSVLTVLCGVLWIVTRNGLYLIGALIYGATAVILARRLRG